MPFTRFTLVLVAAFILQAPAFAQYQKLQEVTARKGEIIIPYTKYQLDNGLTVILHEDHSDPLVHVDVTYHVGSAREELQKSGFAHFFEHMMFQGSKHVGDEQHFKIITEAGGQLNGSTNRDRTNYFETLPSNYLETALWLEADRMGFLLDSVTQRKFEIQRETVKNERGQNVDNVPYGVVSERISEKLYPAGHPYSWMTIGYIEDLNRVGVDELRKFFLRWYGPNNAVLTIGGDIDPAKTLEMVVKYFGPIPRGPEVENMKPLDVTEWQKGFTADRYAILEDKIRQPQLDIVFPSVFVFHEDAPAMDCLANILGGGKASMLYDKLVNTEKARTATAYNYGTELSGQFVVSVRAYPDQPLAEIEQLVRATLLEFETRGVTAEDLASYKAQEEAGAVYRLQSVSGKCSRLAYYQTFLGNPDYSAEHIRKVQAVTADDVMRVYQKYIKGRFAVVMSTVPKGQSALAASEKVFTGEMPKWQFVPVDYSKLQLRNVTDNFDRSQRPAPGAAAPVTVPAFWTQNLKNGAEVIGAQNNELPLLTVQIAFKGNYEYLRTHPDKAGIGALATDILNESNSTYSSSQMSMELDKLGSNVSFSFDGNNMVFTIQCLTKHLDATLRLAQMRFMNRTFTDEEFERARKKILENIRESGTRPASIAGKVMYSILYGKNHPQALPANGDEAFMTSFTQDMVKDYLAAVVHPANASMVVVGDADKKTILKKMAFFTKWKATGTVSQAVTVVPAPSVDKTRIYLVNKEGAPQSQIWAGFVSLPYDAAGEYYKAGLMNYTLGGMFNSRLNLTLREKRGFTYGARSSFSGTAYPGIWGFAAGVRANATDSAFVDFMAELKLYVDKGISQDELDFLKKSFNQRDALVYETPGQRAGFLFPILWYDLPADFTQQQRTVLNNTTTDDIQSLARKHMQLKNMVVVIVGDKKSILPGLKKTGYEVWEMDQNGALISKQPE